MHPEKCPGPDGFNPAFFQRFGSIVGVDVFTACTSWLHAGQFLKDLNNIHVTLIPKYDNPATMCDLWPISLCNVVFKIHSKVLDSRTCFLLLYIRLNQPSLSGVIFKTIT